MNNSKRKAKITAICSYLPEKVLTNEDLVNEFEDWSIDKIYDKTGIKERHIADDNECASDLGVVAAKRLFNEGLCKPEEIDFLLFCTQSPDYFLPTTACLIQDRLGLPKSCGAFDFNLGCSGFVYGLSLAKGFIESNLANKILLITAETYSKYIHPKDKSVRTIFGDGAAATLIEAVESNNEFIGPFVFGTDGSGAENLIVPTGGLRQKRDSNSCIEYTDKSGNVRSKDNLYMNGVEIYNFTLGTVPSVFNSLLKKSGYSIDEIDYFVFHQANKFMLEALRKKLGILPERFYNNIENIGNTVSSTIPIALEELIKENKLKEGNKVMLIGFGVGYSWAGTIITL